MLFTILGLMTSASQAAVPTYNCWLTTDFFYNAHLRSNDSHQYAGKMELGAFEATYNRVTGIATVSIQNTEGQGIVSSKVGYDDTLTVSYHLGKQFMELSCRVVSPRGFTEPKNLAGVACDEYEENWFAGSFSGMKLVSGDDGEQIAKVDLELAALEMGTPVAYSGHKGYFLGGAQLGDIGRDAVFTELPLNKKVTCHFYREHRE